MDKKIKVVSKKLEEKEQKENWRIVKEKNN